MLMGRPEVRNDGFANLDKVLDYAHVETMLDKVPDVPVAALNGASRFDAKATEKVLSSRHRTIGR